MRLSRSRVKGALFTVLLRSCVGSHDHLEIILMSHLNGISCVTHQQSWTTILKITYFFQIFLGIYFLYNYIVSILYSSLSKIFIKQCYHKVWSFRKFRKNSFIGIIKVKYLYKLSFRAWFYFLLSEITKKIVVSF